MNLQQVEGQLAAIPAERAASPAKIDALKAQIEASRQRLREMEAKAKSLEMEMKGLEDKANKYKTQQLLVKKNEEYQALTHEIESTATRVSELESDELDEARQAQQAEAAELAEKIEQEKAVQARIDEKEARCRGELDGARAAKEKAESAVPKPALSKYRQVARGIRFPIVVELSDHKCGGCHMRVSSAIDSQVRHGDEITTCDNCGRILYSAS